MWFVAVVAVVSWAASGSPAFAQSPSSFVMRSAHFAHDSKVVNGAWAEARTAYFKGSANGKKLEDVVAGPRIAYGSGAYEAGIAVSFLDAVGDGQGGRGFGDVEIHGKFAPIQTDMWDFAAGLVLLAPSGDASDARGYGEFGFEPFGSAAFRLSEKSPIELRAQGGYRVFAHERRHPYQGALISERAFAATDALFWRAGLFVPTGTNGGLRIEVARDSIDVRGASEPMRIEPGLDIRVPTAKLDVIVRPTGSVGLNKESTDWGIALGIAVNFSTAPEKPKKDPGLPF